MCYDNGSVSGIYPDDPPRVVDALLHPLNQQSPERHDGGDDAIYPFGALLLAGLQLSAQFTEPQSASSRIARHR